MADAGNIDGLKYLMTFSADVGPFLEALKKARAELQAFQKEAAKMPGGGKGPGKPGGGSSGGGGGGGSGGGGGGSPKPSKAKEEADMLESAFGGSSKMSALVVGMELGKAQQFAQGIAEGVWSAVEASAQLFASTTKEAAAFEDMESGLKFAFGDKAGDVFSKVTTEAQKLNFTMLETADLTRSLGIMKINPFGDGKDIQTFTARTGESITALEALQDTASATGKGTQAVMIAIREFMGGNNTSLARRFDIPLTEVKEWRKETQKATDIQGQFNILIDKLSGKYGGATKMREDNLNFILAQIPDLVQQIQAALGKGAAKALTPALKEFMDALKGLLKNNFAIEDLATPFTVVAKALGVFIKAGAKAVELITLILEAAPDLPLFALGLSMAAAAAIGFTAAITSAGLSLAVVAAGIAALGLPVFLTALVPTLVAGAAAIGVFVGAASLLTGAYFAAGDAQGSFMERLRDVRVFIQAASEALSNWGDEVVYISKETSDALNERGMKGYFQEVIMWATHAEQYLKGFWKGFSEEYINDVVRMSDTFNDVVDSVTRVLVAFGLMAPASKTATEEASAAGESMGKRIAGAVRVIADAVNSVNVMFNDMFRNAPDVIKSLGTIWASARAIWNIFSIIGNVLGTVGLSIYATMIFPLTTVFHLVMAIIDGLQAAALWVMGDTEGASKMSDRATSHLTDIRDGASNAIDFGINRVKGIATDLGDIQDAVGQKEKIDNFADRVALSLKDADAQKEQQNMFASNAALEASSKPASLNYTPYDPSIGPQNYAAGLYGNANPTDLDRDPGRTRPPMNITIVTKIDEKAIGEASVSYTENLLESSGILESR